VAQRTNLRLAAATDGVASWTQWLRVDCPCAWTDVASGARPGANCTLLIASVSAIPIEAGSALRGHICVCDTRLDDCDHVSVKGGITALDGATKLLDIKTECTAVGAAHALGAVEGTLNIVTEWRRESVSGGAPIVHVIGGVMVHNRVFQPHGTTAIAQTATSFPIGCSVVGDCRAYERQDATIIEQPTATLISVVSSNYAVMQRQLALIEDATTLSI